MRMILVIRKKENVSYDDINININNDIGSDHDMDKTPVTHQVHLPNSHLNNHFCTVYKKAKLIPKNYIKSTWMIMQAVQTQTYVIMWMNNMIIFKPIFQQKKLTINLPSLKVTSKM